MRIRKNSRLINGGTASLAASSSASPLPSSSSTFLICQLNRSPWDVLDASALQGNWDGIFESASASDSVHSGESMELSFEYIEKLPTTTSTEDRENGDTHHQVLSGHQLEATQPPPPLMSFSGTTTTAAIPPLPPKKAVATSTTTTATQPKKRGRPRKQPPTTATATATGNNINPYEYYYYSGFGPSWAKRRGAERPIEDEMMIIDNTEKKMKFMKEVKQKLKDDDVIKKKDNGVMLVVDDHHGLDYIDDYDDNYDDDNDDDLYGRRGRARKPIKARSLKSLM